MAFDVEQTKQDLIAWLQDWFEKNGKGCNAVIGISGGKDSSVTAALCVAALGKDRVIGVLMPNGVQADIDDAKHVVAHLGIKHFIVNIKDAYEGAVNALFFSGIQFSEQARVNLPPRIRMSTLYAISQSMNGRVINTCNLSEDWVGYSTRYGDSVGDVCPLGKLTVTEVKELGTALGLPDSLVHKVPSDGLCGKTDEDNLGFTYAVLDRYIRTGEIDDPETKKKIDYKHRINKFKLELMQTYKTGLPELADDE
ncbi:MAG: NAD(+) synthase [Clostridia bacterium]|nr:NAD(+) synthase [Clostridia bacterium]